MPLPISDADILLMERVSRAVQDQLVVALDLDAQLGLLHHGVKDEPARVARLGRQLAARRLAVGLEVALELRGEQRDRVLELHRVLKAAAPAALKAAAPPALPSKHTFGRLRSVLEATERMH